MRGFDRTAAIARDRRNFIGGSDARTIMGKDEKALHRLWREKRGEASALDLSSVLIIQLGLVTEDLNCRWYEQNSDHRISDIQRHAVHPTIPWMAATLDGLVKETGAVFEAKFMLRGRSRKRLVPRSTWPSFSTTCWSPAPGNRCSRSSMAVASGLNCQLKRTRSRAEMESPDHLAGKAAEFITTDRILEDLTLEERRDG
jgi:YqaJ-like viral recombinase domain